VLLTSIALVTFALALLATNFTINDPPVWLAMVSLCTFVSAFSIGEGPVTWVLVAEIFPMSIRSKGTSLAMGLNRMMSGAIATLFLSMNQVRYHAGNTGQMQKAILPLYRPEMIWCLNAIRGIPSQLALLGYVGRP
jgi:MFS family permease